MIGPCFIPLFILGQLPFDLDCRGRFELQSRVEPMRIFPGEDLFWTLRISAKGPWKRGPDRPALGEDPALISAFAIKAMDHETPSRFPEGVTGPPGKVWEYTWKLTPLALGGQKNSYPPAIPEVGFVLTRDDVPWQSLAREIIWIGPLPLSYREGQLPYAPEEGVGFVLVAWGIISLFIILVMFSYEFFWARKRLQKLSIHLETSSEGEALAIRREFKRLLREAGLVLPEEPEAQAIHTGILLAGYGPRLSTEARELWNDLNHAAFNRDNHGYEKDSSPIKDDIKNRFLALARAFHWRFWKRRLVLDPGPF